MTAVTTTALNNAALDLASLSDVVNGAYDLGGTGIVTTRLSQTIKTAAKVIHDLEIESEGALDDILYSTAFSRQFFDAVDAAAGRALLSTSSTSEIAAAITAAINVAIPFGSIRGYPLETPPTGWLECDGSAISRTTYANLFAVIYTYYGIGNGSTTFNLPDLRGVFPRFWAHGTANDPDRATRTNRGDGTTGDHVGTRQTGQNMSHTHAGTTDSPSGSHTHQYSAPNVNTGFTAGAVVGGVGGFVVQDSGSQSATHTHGFTTGYSGGNQSNPINVNLTAIIKAY